jgi:hypothetical protein
MNTHALYIKCPICGHNQIVYPANLSVVPYVPTDKETEEHFRNTGEWPRLWIAKDGKLGPSLVELHVQLACKHQFTHKIGLDNYFTFEKGQ